MPTLTLDNETSVVGTETTNSSRTMGVRITENSNPPLLPTWLRVTFRLDVDFVTKYRELCTSIPKLKPDAIAGSYLWYKEVNDALEEAGNENRLLVMSREARQHYVVLANEYDIVLIGATRWNRKLFTIRGLMNQPVRKYQAISAIFGHSHQSTTLPRRVAKEGNLDTIGLEIEVQIPNCSSGSEAASKIYNEGTLDIRGGRFVLPCYDNSIGSYGVEYKTGIFDMSFWRGKVATGWRETFHNMKFKAYTAPECGLHINIGRNNTYKSLETVKMVQAFLFSAYWNGQNSPIAAAKKIEAVYEICNRMAGRDYLENRYCSGQSDELGYILIGKGVKYQPLRYGSDRVEFRIFQSTTNPTRLLALPDYCIELGKSAQRLKAVFNENSWATERDFRAKWGQLVLADLFQRCDNEQFILWLKGKMQEGGVDISPFLNLSLPDAPGQIAVQAASVTPTTIINSALTALGSGNWLDDAAEALATERRAG